MQKCLCKQLETLKQSKIDKDRPILNKKLKTRLLKFQVKNHACLYVKGPQQGNLSLQSSTIKHVNIKQNEEQVWMTRRMHMHETKYMNAIQHACCSTIKSKHHVYIKLLSANALIIGKH